MRTRGITPGIRRAFVVYLSSSNRPIHEVLFPPLRDIRHDYEHNFHGMTTEPVPLDALLAARERMVREIQQGLDDNEQRFLLSLAAGAPEWSLLGIAHLEQLPGICRRNFLPKAHRPASIPTSATLLITLPGATWRFSTGTLVFPLDLSG